MKGQVNWHEVLGVRGHARRGGHGASESRGEDELKVEKIIGHGQVAKPHRVHSLANDIGEVLKN